MQAVTLKDELDTAAELWLFLKDFRMAAVAVVVVPESELWATINAR